MIARILITLFSFLPLVVFAQAKNNGLTFLQELSWTELREKAQKENKLIFVDCYASWCRPCKAMDEFVYSNDSIGKYANSHFVSVKIQFDTSGSDTREIKNWYSKAKTLGEQFSVTSFPTYLFFSPSGNIVHRDEGFKYPKDFMKVMENAIDPKNQYYTLIQDYKNGDRNYEVMKYLASMAKSLNQNEIADVIAKDYLQNYLFKQDLNQLLVKQNLEFIYSFDHLLSSNDEGFKLFFNWPNKVDSIMEFKGLSIFICDYIITKEIIEPILNNCYRYSKTPHWDKLYKLIKRRHNEEYAFRNLLNAKIEYYERVKDWKRYLNYAIKKIEYSGIDTTNISNVINVNYISWMIFLHSTRKERIKKALNWMESLNIYTTKQAGWLDTYANLLYKIGRVKEALVWEEKAFSLAPHDKEIKKAYLTMKSGLPTWRK